MTTLMLVGWVFVSGYMGAWSTHTKPSHTRVISHHFWSTHTIYEIKKDYSEGGLWYLAPIVGLDDAASHNSHHTEVHAFSW